MTSSASLNWVQNFSTGICLPINESLRVSDIKRGESCRDICMPRRGAWATEGNDD